MTDETSSAAIHEAVLERYGALARASASCCGPDESCGEDFYPVEALEMLPESVTGLSLGCGNPLDGAHLQPGETVLDLGSGGGIDCFLAAREVGSKGRVIGVDMTPDMLAKARANAAKLNVTNVEFRQGLIEQLPVADGEVDVILSNCVINLAPDKAAVFAEMFRALKSGGRVHVADVVTHGPMAEHIAQDNDSWAACVAGALPDEVYAALLAEAGFADVQVQLKGEFNEELPQLPLGEPYSTIITARKP